jgi:hypothetical protein
MAQKTMTLKDRVEEALEITGIPRAGEQQRGWLAESNRPAVRLYWGYGAPVIKAAEARSYLSQCSQALTQAGFQVRAPANNGPYLEILA